MKGSPKYKIGDKVHFELTIEGKKYSEDGEVVVVDKYGTWFDNSDVSYMYLKLYQKIQPPIHLSMDLAAIQNLK